MRISNTEVCAFFMSVCEPGDVKRKAVWETMLGDDAARIVMRQRRKA